MTPDYAGGSFSVELSGAPAPAHAAVTVQAGAAAPVTIDFASLQDFDKNSQRSYPPREESYVLIVAASSGWENYRHQAGAYLMYQMLKSNGLDDDHILLVRGRHRPSFDKPDTGAHPAAGGGGGGESV